MKLEKGKISRLQLYFLSFAYILGSSLLLSIIDSLTKQDIWIVVILGLLESSIFIAIILALSRRFSGKTLIDINDLVYGPFLGKIISAFYILYLAILIPLNLRYISDFFSNTILESTPNVAIIIVITILCAYAVKRGLEVFTRCSFLLVSLFVLEVIFTLIVLLYKLDFTNFLPIMEISTANLIKSANVTATIPFGELFVFLMIFPFVKNNKKIIKPIYYALFSGGLMLLIIVVRNVAVLGSTAALYTYPSYQTARLINIKDILTRIEVLMALTILIVMFLKISVIYYALVMAIAELFNLRTYLPIVLPIVFIILALSLINFEFFIQQIRFGINTAPLIALPVQFVLPLLTLIIAKIRKKE